MKKIHVPKLYLILKVLVVIDMTLLRMISFGDNVKSIYNCNDIEYSACYDKGNICIKTIIISMKM